MGKYDGKAFNDPILRCEQCSKITHRAYIVVNGGCLHCGNRRFKNVRGLSGEEDLGLRNGTLDIGVIKPYEIDLEYLDMFEDASGEVEDHG